MQRKGSKFSCAVDISGVVCVSTTTETINGDFYCDFLQRFLLPQLLPFNGSNSRSVIILDNTSIHHVPRAVRLIQSVGAIVHFLPAYSPDLNPIEELFFKVKYFMKLQSREFQEMILL